jgi:hypothetical protein
MFVMKFEGKVPPGFLKKKSLDFRIERAGVACPGSLFTRRRRR